MEPEAVLPAGEWTIYESVSSAPKYNAFVVLYRDTGGKLHSWRWFPRMTGAPSLATHFLRDEFREEQS